MEALNWVALTLMIAMMALGLYDGVYLHLRKFRLHARMETRSEHWMHTIRAWLAVGALVLVYQGTTSGALLWVGITLIALDLSVQAWDMVIETRSRAFQGGLPSSEFRLHMLATAVHLALIVTSLSARPVAAFSETIVIDNEPAKVISWLSIHVFAGGAVLLGVLHLLLMHPRFSSDGRPPESAESIPQLQ